MVIHHLGIQVLEADLDQVLAFYTAALEPLGYKEAMRFGTAVGFGGDGGVHTDFWVTGQSVKPTTVAHVAFAGTRAQVDAFHAAAIKFGAKDNGAPGIRAQYHPNYYGAFVFDPAGNNIEVVCFQEQDGPK
ncbi:glyoxalase/bleomycin resistance protein/dioxygenase [Magnaporthiopsis poae ATCC 64411]|uniref:Glyoxalase/bleomycin resistance protein/dioxygenase n=1 Tax=Magnaporthiopsis poae (strain ATCC 64411 / 73-15) TaxID=644358 RepID=A0A0C4DKD3_MAGP6|nr:glyoxalase/bleomycin resistance protein/dioxygenase [Magnaporthiopsis poae ATCC 64411]